MYDFEHLVSEAGRHLPGTSAREAILVTSVLAAELMLKAGDSRKNVFAASSTHYPVLSNDYSLSTSLAERETTLGLGLLRKHRKSLRLGDFPEAQLTYFTSELERALAWGGSDQLADYLAREWVHAQAPDHVWPTIDVADFALSAIRTTPFDRVRCRGPGAEPAAIACIRAGVLPDVEGDELPAVAQAYLVLAQARSTGSNERWFLPRISALAPSAPGEIIVPEFGLPLEDRRGSRQDLNQSAAMSEWSALHLASRSPSEAAAVFVANRVLYARGTAESAFRKELIDSGSLRAVVSFPPGALNAADVPSAICLFDRRNHLQRTNAIFCRVDENDDFTFESGKLRTRDRRFSGAERILKALGDPAQPWCRSVSYDEISREDYVLHVERYLDADIKARLGRASHRRVIRALQEVASVTKAQTLRSSSNTYSRKVREISPSEFPQHGYLNTWPRSRLVNADDLSHRSRQIIQPGDILLSSKGAIGRTALCLSPDPSAILVPSPSITILRLERGGPIKDPTALLMYLRSPLFQAQLRAITVGTTIPNISPADLRKLPIVVPTLEEQQQLRAAFETQVRLQYQIHLLEQEQALTEYSILTTLGLAEPAEAS
jgi:hypothetical protein